MFFMPRVEGYLTYVLEWEGETLLPHHGLKEVCLVAKKSRESC